MPESYQLNVNKIFDLQKRLVITKIIPALLKELDPAIFLIGEGVLYEIIY